MNEEVEVNKKTEVYLKMLIPIIRAQPGHETFGWDESINYLIDRLNGMRDDKRYRYRLTRAKVLKLDE